LKKQNDSLNKVLKNTKLISLEEAAVKREALRSSGQKMTLTNGCFDLLHTGHIYFLEQASLQGGKLFIALNGTPGIQKLKGPTRPLQSDEERAYSLAALHFVDTIVIFDTPRLNKEIEALKPDIYVKAGDYNIDSINKEEREALESVGSSIRFLPFLQGYSTTSLIEKIHKAFN
jgi:D-glycero-beta-D-manno-heptose 1-phosphate adenylyltransferase